MVYSIPPISILIATFYMNIAEKLMQEAEQRFLIKTAYTDELTQLYNRHICSEHMKEVEKLTKKLCKRQKGSQSLYDIYLKKSLFYKL